MQPLRPNLISVIIPAHNAAAYISRCLASVVSQDFSEVEVLIIDDGSQDETHALCKQLMAKDRRVQVFSVEHGGPSSARNHGLERASGEFVCFVDADDYLEKGALTTLHGSLRDAQADLAVGAFCRRNEQGDFLEEVFHFRKPTVLEKPDLVTQACRYLEAPNRSLLFAYSWGRLFKLGIIKTNQMRFDISLRTYEDVAFNFAYLRYTKRISYEPSNVYNHVVRSAMSSATFAFGNAPERLFGFQSALDSASRFLRDATADDVIDQKVGHAYVVLTIIQLVRLCGQWCRSNRIALRNFVASIARDPRLRANLVHYRPNGTDSRLVPLFLKARLPLLIIWVCRYKAWRRYRRQPGVPRAQTDPFPIRVTDQPDCHDPGTAPLRNQ
jgi:glycosyltransferase involved in cell wall biosynthesis